MQKLLKSKNIVLILLSIIMVMLISINVVNGSFVFSDGNNFKWIILVAIFYIYFSKVSEKYNKRLFTISSVYGVVISIFYILGFLATNEQIPSCKKDYILILARFSACFIAVTSFMIIIMDSLPKIKERIKNIKEYKFFTANKKSFILVAVILFLAYVPYILNYFPGNVLIDSVIQILQGLGAMELTNHHPVLHTGIIAICMHIGNGLFNSYQIGAFIYTLLQTICTSLIFSFCIYYMARKNVPVPIRVISLLFFMFCPTICFYTITMYKDIPFALSILLLTICLTELVINTENFFKSKLRIFLLIVAILLSVFFRNNGIYAIILTFPFVLIIFRKYYKKILIAFIVPIVIYFTITGPIYNLIGIEKGSTREALSVPIQQFARLMTYKSDELTEEQKNKIKQYLPIENFGELYMPGFADPIKSNFSEEGFEKDKIGLIKLYFELALEFPIETIESFVHGSFGYYYPNTVGWGVYTGVNTEQFGENEEYKFEAKPIIKIGILYKINEFVNTRNIPIISMVISIGFLFWVVLACITYIIYQKKYRRILIFLPVIFVWLTALASPVFCEPRYVYSIFTCLPLFIGILFIETKNQGVGK